MPAALIQAPSSRAWATVWDFQLASLLPLHLFSTDSISFPKYKKVLAFPSSYTGFPVHEIKCQLLITAG